MHTPEFRQDPPSQEFEPSTAATELLAELSESKSDIEDPWANSPWPAPSAETLHTSERSNVSAAINDEVRSRADERKADHERREKLTQARLTVNFDRQRIMQIADQIPDPPINVFDSIREGPEYTKQILDERRNDIVQTLETMYRLPEQLDFKPGVTLILGENGAGKSTLAKALRYAALYAQMLNEGEEQEFAFNHIFHPKASDGRVELNQSGMAGELAQTISVQQLDNKTNRFPYYNPTETIGYRHALEQQMGRSAVQYDKYGMISGERDGEYTRDGRSHRQTVDEMIFDRIKHEGTTGPQIIFIDEPETGMSPKRHRILAEELQELANASSVLIVPTNSIILADSDFPRIDLEYPERGIFRPSEYPQD